MLSIIIFLSLDTVVNLGLHLRKCKKYTACSDLPRTAKVTEHLQSLSAASSSNFILSLKNLKFFLEIISLKEQCTESFLSCLLLCSISEYQRSLQSSNLQGREMHNFTNINLTFHFQVVSLPSPHYNSVFICSM